MVVTERSPLTEQISLKRSYRNGILALSMTSILVGAAFTFVYFQAVAGATDEVEPQDRPDAVAKAETEAEVEVQHVLGPEDGSVHGLGQPEHGLVRQGTHIADTESRFLEIPDAESALSYALALSSDPCLAGTPGAYKNVRYLEEKLIEFGIPKVEIFEYETLRSRPTAPNHVEVLSPEPYVARLKEPVVPEDPYSSHPDIVQPMIGYSASGEVTGDLVYVNKARPEDFQLLQSFGYNLEGKIGIARYGGSHRGVKIMNSENNGLAGLLLYSEPGNSHHGDLYPKGTGRPPFGVARGHGGFVNLFVGDPLTPGKPALPGMLPEDKKYTVNTTIITPSIPVIPMGYGDAVHILRQLTGTNVKTTDDFYLWQGRLPLEYHVGGNGHVVLRMRTEMEFPLEPLFDVVATIEGSEEPDRQILLGNHHDGWTFGGGDPHCGTGPVLEVARAFGTMLREGWKPKRTIKICFWDGEEHGLQGSTEWVEHNIKELQENAVIYHNTDSGGVGTFFSNGGAPSVHKVFRDIAQQVVKSSGRTVYEDWSRSQGAMGTGSDFTTFYAFAGIPISSTGFGGLGYYDKNGNPVRLPFGAYHSAYDNNFFVKHFTPPESLKLCAQVLGLAVLKFSEADILPFVYEDYADKLDGYIHSTERVFATYYHDIDTSALTNAIQSLRDAVRSLRDAAIQISKDAAGATDKATKREINDRLMYTERGFLADEVPLYNRPDNFYKHTIYAASIKYGYSAVIFPGVTEASEDVNMEATEKQLEVLISKISKAANILAGRTDWTTPSK